MVLQRRHTELVGGGSSKVSQASAGVEAAPMADTERQTAKRKVLWHFTMSLDGFVVGPNHAMDWMTGLSFCPGLVDGIRLFDDPGGAPVRLELLNGDDRAAAVNVRYHPVA